MSTDFFMNISGCKSCSLSPNQWGFAEGKSTTVLLSFTRECQEALDNGCSLTSAKTFDSVPHKPLLHKFFKWIHFLSGGYKAICLAGLRQLCWVHYTSCLPRSVLGPHLFLVYIDGAATSVLHSKIAMHVCQLHRSLHKYQEPLWLHPYHQRDFTSLCCWLSINYLTLKLWKCCYMLFSRKHQPPGTELYVEVHLSCTC